MTPTATTRKSPSPVAEAEQARTDAAGRVTHSRDNLEAARTAHQALLDRLAAGDDTVDATELTAAKAALHRAELLERAAAAEQVRADAAVTAAHTAALIADADAYLRSDPQRRVREQIVLAQRAIEDARIAEQELIEKVLDFGRRFRDAGLPLLNSTDTDSTAAGYRGYDRTLSPWTLPTGFTVAGRGITAPTSPWSPR